jgi:hypothetical protein
MSLVNDQPILIDTLTDHSTNMKNIWKTNIVLSIAAVFLTVAFATPAAAHRLVHFSFSGAMQGTEIDMPQGDPPTTLAATGHLPGLATVFGQFSFNFQLTVTLATATATGTATLITTDGDSINTTIAGSLETTTTPGISIITEFDTITGGTGKFAGAKGFFIVERLANPLPPPGTGLTSGSFHGTIALPK